MRDDQALTDETGTSSDDQQPTGRTARERTSEENLSVVLLMMTPLSQKFKSDLMVWTAPTPGI